MHGERVKIKSQSSPSKRYSTHHSPVFLILYTTIIIYQQLRKINKNTITVVHKGSLDTPQRTHQNVSDKYLLKKKEQRAVEILSVSSYKKRRDLICDTARVEAVCKYWSETQVTNTCEVILT
jgi:hypothetical protein